MATRTIANGGGNWNATSTWVEGVVPTASDDVVATSSSGALTITAAASARSIDFTNYTGTLTHNAAVTLTLGTTTTNGSLSLRMVSGMTYTLGSATTSAISFASSSGTQEQITCAGMILGNVTFGTVAGGSWLLVDGFTTGAAATILHTNGTLNTNSQTCSWGFFSSNITNTRTVTLGASAITLTGASSNVWNMQTTTNLTFNAGTSTITCTGASSSLISGAVTFNNFVSNGSGAATINASGATFANFSRTGAADNAEVMIVSANFTVTNTLTLASNGASPKWRMIIESNVVGTSRTITAANVSLTSVDFMDMTGAGAATWSGSSLGDCQGNSGITFTTAVTRYGVVAGNWSSTATWSASSGGAGGQSVPLPQDTVIFDANSAASIYVADMPRMGASVTCTGFTHILNLNQTSNTIFGNLTLASGMSLGTTQTMTFGGRGAQTITSAGKSFVATINWTSPGGSYTLQDNFAVTSAQCVLAAGTLTANANVNIYELTSNSAITGRVINMGSGTWTLTNAGTVWLVSVPANGLTINAQTSTIVISDTSATAKTFTGAGASYNNLSITGGGTGAVTFSGNNSFNNLTINAPKSVVFTSGNTNTVSSFTATGSSGNLVTITATTAGTAATLSKSSGIVSCNWLSLKDSAATGGASWYAGANSTNVSNNTGWNFINAPSAVSNFFALFD
jgi:hypothetical protein